MTAEKPTTLRLLLIVYVLLLALLALTVMLAFVPMHGYEAIFAYLIAIAKAVLVVLFFMEVRRASRLTWIFVSAGFLWLGILLVLTLTDYATRGWRPGRPGPAQESVLTAR